MASFYLPNPIYLSMPFAIKTAKVSSKALRFVQERWIGERVQPKVLRYVAVSMLLVPGALAVLERSEFL